MWLYTIRFPFHNVKQKIALGKNTQVQAFYEVESVLSIWVVFTFFSNISPPLYIPPATFFLVS